MAGSQICNRFSSEERSDAYLLRLLLAVPEDLKDKIGKLHPINVEIHGETQEQTNDTCSADVPEDSAIEDIDKNTPSIPVINTPYIRRINTTKDPPIKSKNCELIQTCKACDEFFCTRCCVEDKLAAQCESMQYELRLLKRLVMVVAGLLVVCLVGLCLTLPHKDKEQSILLDLAKSNLPRTCMDLRDRGVYKSGVYTIYPRGKAQYKLDVYCDQDTDGGGWTVFQRRAIGDIDFYMKWQDYKSGFGDVERDHWLGNEKLAELLRIYSNNELRVDLQTVDSNKTYALYSLFSVGDETTDYLLHVGNYSGTAGDSLTYSNGQPFSTADQDNDASVSNCASRFHGGWWYTDCHMSNLNGKYLHGKHNSYADGVNWFTLRGMYESLVHTEMKFRTRR